jgi:hypothetical protein
MVICHDIATCTGSLYWCAQGTREVDATRSLPLHAVTDIYVGKDTPLFKGDAARDARMFTYHQSYQTCDDDITDVVMCLPACMHVHAYR